MSHTPGSWDFACDSYGKVQHSRKYDCVFSSVKGEGGDRLVTVAARIENTHDALLIAAAPDLLDALEGMMNWARRVNRPNPGPEIRNALAAIAKAKGQQ